jgi:hypothetical protein
MENNTKIGIGVVLLAGVGYYFYNKSKSPISNVSSTTVVNQENKPIQSVPPTVSNNYNKEEATAKALVTVKDWIKTYDGLSEDVLNQKSSNQIRFEKQLADLKAIKNPSRENLASISFIESQLLVNKQLLKDAVKRLKEIEYQKVYNILKDLYAQYPKADVNKLMVIMPKFLSGYMLGDDYKYSYDVFATFSIEQKLYFSDIDLYGKWRKISQEKYPIDPRVLGIKIPVGVSGIRNN